MDGHAAKAKELLRQVNEDHKLTAMAANKNARWVPQGPGGSARVYRIDVTSAPQRWILLLAPSARQPARS